jgi:hypothetical protein
VISCHCSRGGKLGVEQGAGGFVDDRQPTGQVAIGQPGFLDRVDLPNFVNPRGARRGFDAWFPGTFGGIDARTPEGLLEGPSRRESGQVQAQFASQFDADDLRPPMRVCGFQGAGPAHEALAGGGAGAVLIARE